ncbi:MAG: hypothetical protein WCH43_06360 [Verrucomicrobiota bacterium]
MDFFFDCPSCKGSLVADDTCVGESTACPHCSKWIQVPPPGNIDLANIEPQQEGVPSRMVIDSILVRELEDARGKFRKLKAEYTELEIQARKGGESGVKEIELEKQIAGNQAQLEQFRQQLEGVLKERDLLATEVAEAQAALKNSHAESEKTRNGKDSALENANRELVEIHTQLGALGLERGQIASELEQAKKAAKAERDEFHKEKKKLDALMEGSHRELTASREKLGVAESERKQIASELADTRRALDASRDTLNSGQKTYAEALDKANKELVSIRARLGETEAARDHLTAELADLKTALAASRQVNDSVRGEGEKVAAELKSLLEAAEKKSAKFEADCKTLHVNIETGSSELAAKREQLHKIRNEQQVTIDANERMKRELKEVRTQLSGMQNERDNYASDLLQLRTQLEESTRQAQTGTAAQGKLQEELKSALGEITVAHQKVKDLQLEHQKMQAKSDETGKALSETQKLLEASGRESSELKQALEQTRKERDQQVKELSHVNTVLARVQGQMDALKLNNNELRLANEQVKKELAQARQHLSAWQGENDTLEATLSNLETQLTNVLKQLNLQRGKSLAAA